MKLFVCITNDARLLPHFLKHYARFGITQYHIAVGPDLSAYVAAKSAGFDVIQYNGFDTLDSVTGGAEAVTAMRELAQGPEEWVCIVDLDEFVEFGEPAPALAARLDAKGFNVARGTMYDRMTLDGRMTGFDDSSDLPSLYPVRVRLVKELMGGLDRKCVLVKGHLRSKGAHHKFHDEKGDRNLLEIAHYKWNDRTIERLREAHDMVAAKGIGWSEQYRTLLDHYDANGRIAWEQFGGVAGRLPVGQKI